VSALAEAVDAHRARALGLWALAGVFAFAFWMALGWAPRPEGVSWTVCALKRVTDISCPGCGMTRALGALARGDLAGAVLLHPLAIPFAAEVALLWGAAGWALVRRHPLRLGDAVLKAAVLWHAVAFLAVWVGRAATGTLPP
jgi:hypothetical protein